MSRLLAALLAFCLFSCSFSQKDLYPNSFFPNSREKKDQGYYAEGEKFSIATQGEFSTQAAKKMFDLGGNIADAAVAASFALSVERPHSTGLGGGGFLLFKKDDEKVPESWDFRERAPFLAHQKMYLDEKGNLIKQKSTDGIHAVAVPGLVKGLLKFHLKYGSLSLKEVIAPAVELARKGFRVYASLASAIEHRKNTINKYASSRKIFMNVDGSAKNTGSLLIQEDLAKSLELIAKEGENVFYNGKISKSILATSKELGGILQKSDFKKYQVIKRTPVSRKYKGNTIYSMAPPSSGGVHVLQILGILENEKLKELGPYHPKSMHLSAAAMQMAFVDRAKYLGDPDYTDVPVKKLLSDRHIKSMRFAIPESIGLNHREAGVDLGLERFYLPHEKSHTTHFSIMDSKGNLISSTQTINGLFGSAVVATGTGIVLNNEMDDFTTKKGKQNLYGAVGGEKNLIEPLKTPLSSMSPTIVVDSRGQAVLGLGSPNGTRIITCVALTLLNHFEYGFDLYDSVALSRYHHQWLPDEIRLEKANFPKKTLKMLKHMRYELREKNYPCSVQVVGRKDGKVLSVSDPRGQGNAYAK